MRESFQGHLDWLTNDQSSIPGSKPCHCCKAEHDMCFELVNTKLFPVLAFPEWWLYGNYFVLSTPLYIEHIWGC